MHQESLYDAFLEDEFGTSRKRQTFPNLNANRHLDYPIRFEHIEKLNLYLECGGQIDYNSVILNPDLIGLLTPTILEWIYLLDKVLRQQEYSLCLDHTPYLIDLLNYTNNYNFQDPLYAGMYLSSIQVSLNSFQIQYKALINTIDISSKLNFEYLATNLLDNQSLRKKFVYMRSWSALIDYSNSFTTNLLLPDFTKNTHFNFIDNNNILCFNILPYKIYIYQTAAILVINNIVIPLQRDVLLMITDLCHQRFNLYLSGEIAKSIHVDNLLIPSELSEFFSIIDPIFYEYKFCGYQFMKALEGIVTGYLLNKDTDIAVIDATYFLKDLKKELCDSLGPEIEMYIDKLYDYLIKLDNIRIDKVSQVFGLFRIYGHPMVDLKRGMHKTRTVGIMPSDFDLLTSRQGYYVFIEQIYNGLIKRGKDQITWDYRLLPTSSYIRKQLEGKLIINHKHGEYKADDWLSVKLTKTFHEDKTFNLSSMILDRSVSYPADELKSSLKRGLGTGGGPSKKLITRFMRSNEHSAKTFLEAFDTSNIPKNWTVAGQCEKELEMNDVPRMFTCLSYDARTVFVYTEELLARHILPLIPQITMTDDLITSSKKQQEVYHPTIRQAKSKQKNKKKIEMGTRDIIMAIDFNKWNITMRYHTCMMIFKALDLLFGFRFIFDNTHKFFEQCYVYATYSGSIHFLDNMDNFLDSLCGYTGHLGGFEGIRQKGWTIVTECHIEAAARLAGIQMKLIGQGDNQVLKIKVSGILESGKETINTTNTMKNQFENFKNILYTSMQKIGLKIKSNETWISEHLFTYGKNIVYNGQSLCMSQKKSCKIMDLANSGFPTNENEISTIFGNAMAASQSDIIPHIYFLMASFWSCTSTLSNLYYNQASGLKLYNSIHGRCKWQVSTKEDVIVNITDINNIKNTCKIYPLITTLLYYKLWCPRILGGNSIQLLSTFFYRGFPDPLTENISMLKLMLSVVEDSSELSSIITTILNPPMLSSINPLMILQDPVSINLLKPSEGSGLLENEVLDTLQQSKDLKNDSFKSMLKLLGKQNEELATQLFSITPYHGIFMSDIADATIEGYARSVISKISKTGSILERTTKNRGDKLRKSLARSEIYLLWYYLFRIQNRYIYNKNVIINSCSVDIALNLRSYWGKEIRAVTVPHPSEFVEFTPGPFCRNCNLNNNFITIKIDNELLRDPLVYKHTTGPGEPYIGSMTREKVKKMIGNLEVSILPVAMRPIELLRAVNWVVAEETPCAKALMRCAEATTNLKPHYHFASAYESTGSAPHRYHSIHINRHGYSSNLPIVSRYLHLSTNTLGKYQMSQENNTIHYQVLMIYCQQMITNYLVLDKDSKLPPYFHAHIMHETCIRPSDEDDISSDPTWELIKFTKGAEPYTYFKIDDELNINPVEYAYGKYESIIKLKDNSPHSLTTLIDKLFITEGLTIGHDIRPVISKIQVVWSNKITYKQALQNLLYGLIIDTVKLELFKFRKLPSNISTQDLIHVLYARITNIDNDRLGFLNEIYQNPAIIYELNRSKWFITPKTFPYTKQSLTSTTKQNLLNTLTEEFIHETLYKKPFLLIHSLNPTSTKSNLIMWLVVTFLIDVLDRDDLVLEYIMSNLKYYLLNISNSLTKHELNLFFYNEGKHKRSYFYPYLEHYIQNNVWTNVSPDYLFKITPNIQSQQTLHSLFTVHNEYKTLTTSCKINASDLKYNVKGFTILNQEKPIIKVEPIHYIIRPLQFPNYSVPKILTILCEIKLSYQNKIAVLGDSTGGVTCACGILYPMSQIFYNTYVDINSVLEHSIPTSIPPFFSYINNWKTRIINLHDSVLGYNDISTVDFRIMFESIAQPNKFSTVIIDAETYHNEIINFIPILTNILKIQDNCYDDLLIKFYPSQPDELSLILSILDLKFSYKVIHKSYFSPNYSNEIYIYAKAKNTKNLIDKISVNKDQYIINNIELGELKAKIITFWNIQQNRNGNKALDDTAHLLLKEVNLVFTNSRTNTKSMTPLTNKIITILKEGSMYIEVLLISYSYHKFYQIKPQTWGLFAQTQGFEYKNIKWDIITDWLDWVLIFTHYDFYCNSYEPNINLIEIMNNIRIEITKDKSAYLNISLTNKRYKTFHPYKNRPSRLNIWRKIGLIRFLGLEENVRPLSLIEHRHYGDTAIYYTLSSSINIHDYQHIPQLKW